MRSAALVLAAMGASAASISPAIAAPVDLHCRLDAPNKKRSIDFTLDEDRGTASWQWDTSAEPFTKPAIFTATKVTMGTITIDRVSLQIQQQNPQFLIDQGYPPVSTGQCEVRVTKRAF